MGEMIQFDEHIFQMGWNHQPATHLFSEVFKWVITCCNSTYRGYKPSYPFLRPFIGVITPRITSRGPPAHLEDVLAYLVRKVALNFVLSEGQGAAIVGARSATQALEMLKLTTRVKGRWYCRWLKSCTTWDVWNPINNGINYQSQLVNAGFQPSTVGFLGKLRISVLEVGGVSPFVWGWKLHILLGKLHCDLSRRRLITPKWWFRKVIASKSP